MGDVRRNLTLLAALLALALPAAAQSNPPKEAPGGGGGEQKSAAAMAQQALDAGIKAYGAGRFDEAQRAFEAALRGGLPSGQMARLLYYRGLAHRKQNKPGLAISDLNGALWLRGGLSEAERQDAIKARALAYNESGIAEVPPVPQSAHAQAPVLPGQNADAASAWQSATVGTGPDAPTPASNAAAAPTPNKKKGGLSGFFANLFSGGSSSDASDEVTTASINSAPPPAAQPLTSGWDGTTEVSAAPAADRAPEIAAPFVTQVASVEQSPKAGNAGSAAAGGKYRLQVASVRSRSEAEALAGLVVGRHAEHLGGRQPEVDEAIIGSMGTFYRVRLGPFASASEPEQLCGALRADGFDCLVVTQ